MFEPADLSRDSLPGSNGVREQASLSGEGEPCLPEPSRGHLHGRCVLGWVGGDLRNV